MELTFLGTSAGVPTRTRNMLSLIHISAVIAFHHRDRTLAIFRIVQRHDKRLLYLRMRHDDPFHLLRLDPFPTAEKEIIQAPEESEPSIDDLAAIAGGKPPFVVGQWQQLTVAPVARGHTRRQQPDLAGNDFHLPPRQRRAHIRRAVGLFGADGGSKFGQAIACLLYTSRCV